MKDALDDVLECLRMKLHVGETRQQRLRNTPHGALAFWSRFLGNFYE